MLDTDATFSSITRFNCFFPSRIRYSILLKAGHIFELSMRRFKEKVKNEFTHDISVRGIDLYFLNSDRACSLILS
jgi:hypothetical protein